jgi:Group II intron, maturase-specific domain
MSNKRQKSQLVLTFTEEGRSEALKAVLRCKQKIRELTRRTRGIGLEQMLKELAAYLRGWKCYFGFCCPSRFRLPTSTLLVFPDYSMALRNPPNRRMRARTSWWCGRGEQAAAPPMPIPV